MVIEIFTVPVEVVPSVPGLAAKTNEGSKETKRKITR